MNVSSCLEELKTRLSDESLTRYEKGYHYEMVIQNIMDEMNIDYEGNSKNPVTWRKSTNTGFDIRIKTPKGTWLTIECKLCLKPIYSCWVKRDWLSRTADIFVTNNLYCISYKDRREFEKRGKKLMSTTELIIFLERLFRKKLNTKGNQSPIGIVYTIHYLQKIIYIMIELLIEQGRQKTKNYNQKEDQTLGSLVTSSNLDFPQRNIGKSRKRSYYRG
jgi:hypothetical protein